MIDKIERAAEGAARAAYAAGADPDSEILSALAERECETQVIADPIARQQVLDRARELACQMRGREG